MWYEIFKFEIKYRIKRPETYIFFSILFLFSIVAFNFLSQGQNFGGIKENAPYLISRTMAVVTGLFMIISSMIMGVPILRDFEYNMESLLFINPIKKRDYLIGRFLGSFVLLIFIFSGLLCGIILGDYMPWRDTSSLLPFDFWCKILEQDTTSTINYFLEHKAFQTKVKKKKVAIFRQSLIQNASFTKNKELISALSKKIDGNDLESLIHNMKQDDFENYVIRTKSFSKLHLYDARFNAEEEKWSVSFSKTVVSELVKMCNGFLASL